MSIHDFIFRGLVFSPYLLFVLIFIVFWIWNRIVQSYAWFHFVYIWNRFIRS